MLLEHLLHVSQSLNLLGEATESGHTGGIQEMVFEDSVLRRIGEVVVFAILLFEELMNLGCGEFVRVTPIDLGQYSITRLDVSGRTVLSQQFVRDHLLDHSHRAGLSGQLRKFDLTDLKFLGEGQDSSILDYQLGNGIVLRGEFVQRDDLSVL